MHSTTTSTFAVAVMKLPADTDDCCRVKELELSMTVQLSFTLHLNNVLLVLRSSEHWLEKVMSVYVSVTDLFLIKTFF